MDSTPASTKACAASIALQEGQGRRPRWINKHLGKLRKQDHQQGMGLVLVARCFIAQSAVHAHQFPIRGNAFGSAHSRSALQH
jgi:hypothetical protein